MMRDNTVRNLSATEAKNRFGALLREVARTDGPVFVERDGRAVAVILSVRAYEATCRAGSLPVTEQAEFARTAFGMWVERKDIDDGWLARGRTRWLSEWPGA